MNIIQFFLKLIRGDLEQKLKQCQERVKKLEIMLAQSAVKREKLQRRLENCYKTVEELKRYKEIFELKVDVDKDVVIWNMNETHSKIRSKFSSVRILVEDGKHRIVSLKTMQEIVNDWMEYLKQFLRYIVDFFDCDDFSRVFKDFVIQKYKINCVARVFNYTGGHSFNLLILKDGVFIFEPQTGQILTKEIVNRLGGDYKRLYKVDGEIVLI